MKKQMKALDYIVNKRRLSVLHEQERLITRAMIVSATFMVVITACLVYLILK